MTMIDDRPDVAVEPHDPVPRHRSRALIIALACVGLFVVVFAVAIGGGGGAKHDTAVSPLNAPSAVGTNSTGSASTGSATPVFGGNRQGGSAAGAADRSAVGAAASKPLTAAPDTATAPNAPSTPVDPITKVVKTGEIDLQVDKHQVPHTIDKLIALARLEGGFVADSHSSEGVAPSGSVTLRVPVQSFEATISEVRTHIAGKVLEQQTAGEDVTSKYVDLQARIHSLVTTRTTYERLLSRANTIGDILSVQARVSDLQTQIEQLQGELRVLDDQTTYGTLTVTVSEAGAPPKTPVVHHQSGMSKAFHRSLDRFVHGIEAIVGIIGPLLLVGLIVGIGYVAFRLLYRRFGGSAAGARPAGAVGDDRLVGEQ